MAMDETRATPGPPYQQPHDSEPMNRQLNRDQLYTLQDASRPELNLEPEAIHMEQLGIPISAASQPIRRPLGILDLPDDILIMICGYMRGWDPDERWMATWSRTGQEVKSLRLTCKRLRDASSHLLIYCLNVEMTPSSLARLEDVSRHPIIRRGVRVIRVHLHFHDSKLAGEVGVFAHYYRENLRKKYEAVEHILELPFTINSLQTTEEEVRRTVDHGNTILGAWHDFLYATPQSDTSKDSLHYQKLLVETWAEYRNRFDEQERLHRDEGFLERVTTAISQMPVARLEFHDRDLRFQSQRIKKIRSSIKVAAFCDDECLKDHMLLPISWEEAGQSHLSQPPAEYLLGLPVALCQAGVSIFHLDIRVSPPENITAFSYSRRDLRALTAAVQELKSFTYIPPDREAWALPLRDPNKFGDMKTFLSAVLDTNSLKYIYIDFGFLWNINSLPVFNLTPLITQRSWKNLESFSAHCVPIHLSELIQLVNQIPSSTVTWSMDYMHLLSGTWAEALDVLKKKSTSYWSIEYPSGAECDSMSDEEKASIFNKLEEDDDEKSLANQYLQGMLGYNPLRID